MGGKEIGGSCEILPEFVELGDAAICRFGSRRIIVVQPKSLAIILGWVSGASEYQHSILTGSAGPSEPTSCSKP